MDSKKPLKMNNNQKIGIGCLIGVFIVFGIFLAVWMHRLASEVNQPLPIEEIAYRVYSNMPYDVLLVVFLSGVFIVSLFFILGKSIRPFKKK